MTQADRVHSTPPTNTPIDTTRRRFLTVAAVGSMIGAGSLAFAAAAPNDVPQAVTTPRQSRPDPAFALIADKLAADIAHCEAIDAQDEADDTAFIPMNRQKRTSVARSRVRRSTRSTGGWRPHHRPRSPASPRCSDLPTRSRTAAWSGPLPTRSGARAGITSYGRLWRRRSRP